MILTALLALAGQLDRPPGAADLDPRQDFDKTLVDRLAASYRELGPVETATLGGGATLRLDDVLESVNMHHPVLVQASARVRGARGERLAAQGGFDPKLGAVGEIGAEGYYDTDALEVKLEQPTPIWGTELTAGYRIADWVNIPSYDPRETLDRGEVKGSLRIPILQDGWIDERRASLRTTALGIDVAEAERDLDTLQLSVQSSEAYWSWVASGESYRVFRALVRLAEVRGVQIDQRVSAGAAPEIDRAENLRSLLSRREKLVQARRKLEQAAIKLSLFYRSDDSEPLVPELTQLPTGVPLARTLPAIELQRGTSRALAGRPEISALESQLDVARVESSLANNQVLPQVDFLLEVSQDFGTNPTPQTVVELESLLVKVGMVLEFPLFLRKGRGKAEKASAKVEEVDAKLTFTRDKVVAEIQDLWSALMASAQRAVVARQSAVVAEAVAEGERVRLRAGATSPFVVNLREQAAADARIVEIEARATLQVALTAWRMVTLVEAEAAG